MSTDDIFKASAKRRAETADEQRQRADSDRAHLQEQVEKARKNTPIINKRLRAALDYFTKHEYPIVRQHGHDIQHGFGLTQNAAVTAEQMYQRLTLYMGPSVVTTFSDPPYRAPYELRLAGNEMTGTITAYFRSNNTNQDQQIDSLNPEVELSDSWLSEVFQGFADRVVKVDEQIDRNRR